MGEVPTPAWITSRGVSGPTYLINRYSGRGALVIPGLLFVVLALLFLVTGRLDLFLGTIAVGAGLSAATWFSVSRFRFMASETWFADAYVLIDLMVRLDTRG